MKTLSVLHVIPSFASGGSERQLTLLAKAQVEAGAKVHLAYLHEGLNFPDAQASGAELHRLPVRGNHDVGALGHLRTLMRRVRPSVVQTWLLHADVSAGLVAQWCGVPWVLSERASADMYARGSKFRLRRFMGRRADMIVANSEAGARYWRESGYAGPVHVVHNIVPAPRGSHLLRSDEAGASGRIVAVGRLSEQKNYAVLLDALEIVLAAHPLVAVEVLGEGHLRPSLQERIDRSAHLRDRVRLVGFVDDVPERLRRAALFVSTSRFEGTANAQLDAMITGCPMVLSDIASHRELADDDTAVFAGLDDVQATAEAISRCLLDPSASRAMAERGRERLQLQEWTPERIAERYLDLYGALACHRGG